MAYGKLPTRRGIAARRALSGDMAHGPSWYRAMEGVQSRPQGQRIGRNVFGYRDLGSLGQDDGAPTSLTQPTINDPYVQATLEWQAKMLKALSEGAKTLELQRWMQIAATLSIPLAAAAWRVIFPHLKARWID